MVKVLGIDLGTSSSAGAVMIDGNIKIIPSSETKSQTIKPFPSAVTFFDDGSCLIGSSALEQSLYNPEGFVSNIKRKMGSGESISVFGKEYIPQFISALILLKIKIDAEKFLNEKITKAVITVPAYFNDNQRQATKDAGKIAGLDVVQILTEPVAAAIAYGTSRKYKSGKILVFDMGAGTLDVSIVDVEDGFYEVLTTTGNTDLGGIDMDKEIENHLIAEFKKQNTPYDDQNEFVKIQLKKLAESVKIQLSDKLDVEINEDIFLKDSRFKLTVKITRTEFENMIAPLLKWSVDCINQALNNANLSPNDIDQVIPIGGPTKTPAVKQMLSKMIKLPEEGIDPDFTVSVGAAIQGAILANDRDLPVLYQGLTLVNVTPLDLGEEFRKKEDHFIKLMISKGTPYPTEHTDIFWVNKPFQTECPVDIWQGDFKKNPGILGNVKIGHFTLNGLSEGIVKQIEITYKIDADGILTVTARELGTENHDELIIDKIGAAIIPPPQLEFVHEKISKIEKQYRRDTLSPYEIPIDEGYREHTEEENKYQWMCGCLQEAKRIIRTYLDGYDEERFERSRFTLFLQLDEQYAFGYIGRTGEQEYLIGIHNALKEKTDANRRTLVVVLIHELLHAIHPEWGHDRIRPAERVLANKACYFDAFVNMDALFLSGRMSMCNNNISSRERNIRIRCD